MIDPILIRKRVAANLSHAMIALDLSLADVAEACNTTGATIHRLRNADHDPAFTLVVKIADYLQVTVDDLISPPKEFAAAFEAAHGTPA